MDVDSPAPSTNSAIMPIIRYYVLLLTKAEQMEAAADI
jgi:hypothetical protein